MSLRTCALPPATSERELTARSLPRQGDCGSWGGKNNKTERVGFGAEETGQFLDLNITLQSRKSHVLPGRVNVLWDPLTGGGANKKRVSGVIPRLQSKECGVSSGGKWRCGCNCCTSFFFFFFLSQNGGEAAWTGVAAGTLSAEFKPRFLMSCVRCGQERSAVLVLIWLSEPEGTSWRPPLQRLTFCTAG